MKTQIKIFICLFKVNEHCKFNDRYEKCKLSLISFITLQLSNWSLQVKKSEKKTEFNMRFGLYKWKIFEMNMRFLGSMNILLLGHLNYHFDLIPQQ